MREHRRWEEKVSGVEKERGEWRGSEGEREALSS